MLSHTRYECWAGSWSRYQAVNPRWLLKSCPGSRLPLLSARPDVTFPAKECHHPSTSIKLHCLLTEAHRCEQLAWTSSQVKMSWIGPLSWFVTAARCLFHCKITLLGHWSCSIFILSLSRVNVNLRRVDFAPVTQVPTRCLKLNNRVLACVVRFLCDVNNVCLQSQQDGGPVQHIFCWTIVKVADNCLNTLWFLCILTCTTTGLFSIFVTVRHYNVNYCVCINECSLTENVCLLSCMLA